MIEDHFLMENELGDRVKVARIVQKLLDGAFGLPDRPWHNWDDWVKGLESQLHRICEKAING
jgi:hypothetical protein